jgi:hypothetical protein
MTPILPPRVQSRADARGSLQPISRADLLLRLRTVERATTYDRASDIMRPIGPMAVAQAIHRLPQSATFAAVQVGDEELMVELIQP